MRHGDVRGAGVSLLFPAGTRPTREDVARLFDASSGAGFSGHVSYRPAQGNWLELLVGGLTFDLSGLAPGEGGHGTAFDHIYGFDAGAPKGDLEMVHLVPAGHVAAGAALEPVLRAMAGLAANLTQHLPAAAVTWHSARTVMEPRYFSRIVFNWLGGGAFPALGLTALVSTSDGGLVSSGLAHFIGQEMQIEARAGETQADTVKLAIRLVDWFLRHGPLDKAQTIEAGDARLLAEPAGGGKLVLVWREG